MQNYPPEERRKRLIQILKNLPPHMWDKVESIRKGAKSRLSRHEFIWYALLQAMATMGNVRGAKGLLENKENYNKVTYRNLAKLSSSVRRKQLQRTLWNAKVRMPDKKAEWLVKCKAPIFSTSHK